MSKRTDAVKACRGHVEEMRNPPWSGIATDGVMYLHCWLNAEWTDVKVGTTLGHVRNAESEHFRDAKVGDLVRVIWMKFADETRKSADPGSHIPAKTYWAIREKLDEDPLNFDKAAGCFVLARTAIRYLEDVSKKRNSIAIEPQMD